MLEPRVPPMRLIWSGLLVALLVGCSEVEELPPPGARGEAVVQLWDQAGGPPTTIRTASITQAGIGDFRNLVLRPVQIRVESPDGVLFINAERGRFRKEATDTLVLESEQAHGVVRLSGNWGGSPFVGTSAQAIFRQGEHLLMMESVELVHRGRAERLLDRSKPVGQPAFEGVLTDLDHLPAVIFVQNQNAVRMGPNRDRPAPIILAALAALPQPLTLPPMPRGARK